MAGSLGERILFDGFRIPGQTPGESSSSLPPGDQDYPDAKTAAEVSLTPCGRTTTPG